MSTRPHTVVLCSSSSSAVDLTSSECAVRLVQMLVSECSLSFTHYKLSITAVTSTAPSNTRCSARSLGCYKLFSTLVVLGNNININNNIYCCKFFYMFSAAVKLLPIVFFGNFVVWQLYLLLYSLFSNNCLRAVHTCINCYSSVIIMSLLTLCHQICLHCHIVTPQSLRRDLHGTALGLVILQFHKVR